MSIVLFRVIDLETSDLAPPASVIEIGFTDLLYEPETKTVEITQPQSKLFRPREPLKPENIAIHHLTDAMLAGYPECTEDDLKAVVRAEFPSFIVAANSAFEKQWIHRDITAPFGERAAPKWLCTVKAAARLFPDAESHANQAMRYRLGLDLPEHLAMPPHRAGPDSYVTAHVLAKFLEMGTRVSHMVHWEELPKWMPVCPIGKQWKGKPWAEVEESFLNWVLRQPDMDGDICHWVRVELERRYPRAAGPTP